MEAPRLRPRAQSRAVGSLPSTARPRLLGAAVRPGAPARSPRSLVPPSLPALPPDALGHAADLVSATLAHAATLAYEPVAAPCSLMNCGDVVHRSTLDPVLRREVNGPDWASLAAIAGAAAAYLFAPPGVLPGAYDYYVRTPLYRRYGGAGSLRALDREDLVLGRRLGAGGFGDVYRATLAEGVPGFAPGRGRRRQQQGAGGVNSNDDEQDEEHEEEEKEDRAVVVKRAKEFGEAEAWMNERLARAAPDSVAGFVAAFEERPAPDEAERRRQRRRQRRAEGGRATGAGGLFGLLGAAVNKDKDADKRKKKKRGSAPSQAAAAAAANAAPGAVWLVWRDEGDRTLADLMGAREWPYSAEEAFLGRELRLPRGARRRAVTVRLAMRQLLGCIAACHRAGIVHRDIKPQNAIMATRGGGRTLKGTGGGGQDDQDDDEDDAAAAAVGRLKLIDLGAAADLRIGINYAPSEYLMDPRYAPPQQYIMQRQTPSPPPLKPVAALLSPVLWLVGRPDRFDAYSAGVTLMQMAFPPLKTDAGLFQFRKKLEEAGWDLREWRRRVEAGGEGRGGGGGGGGGDGDGRGGGGGGARALFGALSASFSSSASAGGGGSSSGPAAPTGYAAGFELLDLDGGQGWELACGLLALEPGDRLSAAAALRRPWFARAPEGPSAERGGGRGSSASSSPLGGTAAVAVAAAQRLLERADAGTGATAAAAAAARSVGDQLGRAAEAAGGAALLESALTHGAGRDGALTEAQLADEFGYADVMSLAALEASEAKRERGREQRQRQKQKQRDNKKQQKQKQQKPGQQQQGGLFGGLFGGRAAAAAAAAAAEEEDEDEDEEDEEDDEEEQQQRQRLQERLRERLPPVFGAPAGPPRNARRTIAWWQERQSDLQRELSARRRGVSRTIRGAWDAGGAAKDREAARRKKAAAAEAVVVAVPARPAAFGGEGAEADAPAPRRPVVPERPGSPAAIAWLTSLLPPASQPSTVAGGGGGRREEDDEEGEGDEEGGVVAAAAAAAAAAQEAAAERKR